jgi:AraC family transcriptional regulator
MTETGTRPQLSHLRATPSGATAAARLDAVERAIVTMGQCLDEPQSLRDLARAAYLSPFHFHRVFRSVTSATPGRFLAAMRMAEAKRLLISSQISVTDISIAVGYSSFGTFTTQFTRLVGMAPGRFRAWAASVAHLPVAEVLEPLVAGPRPVGPGLHGWVSGRPDGSAGFTILGLFRSGIPQDRPIDCAVVTASSHVLSHVHYQSVPRPGTSQVLAMSVAADTTIGDMLAGSPCQGMFLGATQLPLAPAEASARDHQFLVWLRAPRITDPPILVAIPLLARAARLAR